MTTKTIFVKDDDAVLDYVFDWKPLTNQTDGGISDWLADGETISSHSVAISSAAEAIPLLNKDSDALINTNTAVRVWLSAGTISFNYTITCQITTNLGRTDERSIVVAIRQK